MCDLSQFSGDGCPYNPAGTELDLYLVPAEELNGFPRSRETISGTGVYGDDMILDEPFDMTTASAGKGYFRKYPIVVDTGEVKSTTVGEIGTFSFENMKAFYIKGMGAEQKQFAADIAGCCKGFVVVLTDVAGETHVIGNDKRGAFIDALEMGTGVKTADRRGTAYTLKHSSGKPPYSYDLAAHGLDITPN